MRQNHVMIWIKGVKLSPVIRSLAMRIGEEEYDQNLASLEEASLSMLVTVSQEMYHGMNIELRTLYKMLSE